MTYAPFNIKQADYFKRSIDSWLNVAEGGKRAGKNILNILAFADNVETHPDKIHLVGGVTKATAKMNIWDSNGFGLEHYFQGRCRTGTYQGVDCLYIATRRGNKIVLVVGGKDSDDYRSIKGFSLGTLQKRMNATRASSKSAWTERSPAVIAKSSSTSTRNLPDIGSMGTSSTIRTSSRVRGRTQGTTTNTSPFGITCLFQMKSSSVS
jgi:hypothetical protein